MELNRDRGEHGASAVEYGLLIAGIAGLIVAMVFVFGGFVGSVFSDNCTKVRDQVGLTDSCS
jgi:pilus assembly protein Flp/PilA